MDIETLKRMANNKTNWRERLSAVKELSTMNDQPSANVLCRLAIHDPVFTVKEAAFRAAQARKLTYAGKPIFLGRKPQGNLVEGINKKLAVVKNSLAEEFTLEEFKERFQEKYPEAYDIYEGDKQDGFDKWLKNVITSLPKKK